MSRGLRNAFVASLIVLLAVAILLRRVTWTPGSGKPMRRARITQTVGPPPGELGSRVPEFSVTDINGRTLSSAELRGKVLLVDYWATWCKPCEKEMPGYQRLQDKYRERGLVVIGVAFNFGVNMGMGMHMDRDTVAAFARRLGIRYALVQDSPELQKEFGGIQGLPTAFLLDRNRVIRYKVIGFEHTDKVEMALKDLL